MKIMVKITVDSEALEKSIVLLAEKLKSEGNIFAKAYKETFSNGTLPSETINSLPIQEEVQRAIRQSIKFEPYYKGKEKSQSMWTGVSFGHRPVSKEEYIANYEEYVRRCSVGASENRGEVHF